MQKTFLLWSVLVSGWLLFLHVFKQWHTRNSFLTYWCSHLPEPNFSKGSATIFIFQSFSLTSCTPDGPASFGSVFSANQRIITRSQYYFCLQEDPHCTLHVLFTTLVKSYWWKFRPKWALGKYRCISAHRPEFCSNKLRSKEIKYNQNRTLRRHQVKGCNANPNYQLSSVSSTGVRTKDMHLRYSLVLVVHGFRRKGLERSLELINWTWPAHICSHPNFSGGKSQSFGACSTL